MKTYIALCLWIVCLFGVSTLEAAKYPVYTIDDFEDQSIDMDPKWWTFGNLKVFMEAPNKDEFQYVGNHGIRVRGQSQLQYVGGLGTYLGIDGTPYDMIKVLVRGYENRSCFLRFELYDDDNKNWTIEPHPTRASETKFDDRFVYTMKVDWVGWRVMQIPVKFFTDDNRGIGDDQWNPSTKNGSGGLVQMQIIVMAEETLQNIDVLIDSIKLFKQRPSPKKKAVSNDWDEFF